MNTPRYDLTADGSREEGKNGLWPCSADMCPIGGLEPCPAPEPPDAAPEELGGRTLFADHVVPGDYRLAG